MAAKRAYFIPGWGYINEVKGNSYIIPGWGYINETVSTTPPPSNSPYFGGISMLAQGLTELESIVPTFLKGIVKDQYNKFTR